MLFPAVHESASPRWFLCAFFHSAGHLARGETKA